jgi:hypothetical protein
MYDLLNMAPNTFLQALTEFKALKKFEGAWPVTDLMKMHLKYTSTREKTLIKKKEDTSVRAKEKGKEKEGVKDKGKGKQKVRSLQLLLPF